MFMQKEEDAIIKAKEFLKRNKSAVKKMQVNGFEWFAIINLLPIHTFLD